MKNLTRDEFAKWIYSIGQKLENYNFDVFYDIKSFMETENEIVKDENGDERSAKGYIDKPLTTVFNLFVRERGTHLLKEGSDEDIYGTLEREAKQIYKISLCVNCDYFSKPYAIVEELV